MHTAFVLRLLGCLSFLSFGLTFWRWVAAARFPLHHRAAASPALPGCSVLKPLKGCDAETRSCLRSWLAQDYPGPVQILFGVASAEDPVCALVRELLAEFPRADAQLVVCAAALGVNGKISTLRQLEPLIRHAVIVISDADVRVPADFLANVTPAFEDEGVGLVNCLYRLNHPGGLAMRWEAIAINADFWSAVAQAQSLKKVDFALGAVMALRGAQLREIGGFAALADYLADDFHLGRQIARLGRRIVFSPVVVDCHEPRRNWAQAWAHQVRWARTIRVCQPLLFFFSSLDNATFWPLLWLAASAPALAGPVLPACLFFFLFRMVTAFEQERRLTGSAWHLRYFWMTPVKDLLSMAVWVAAFSGNQIHWRGQRYRVLPGGRLRSV
ncbi:MAG TPA: bacteriohopanetetrol glucosamine biosynthesis glycosyltransferase HpnI [Candidatus Acidoferrum sp.]|nr:bacteriohopanetetrol glucosamine biosynthesis glycosyltransferase HpnI [Candidatus Acidoferrum sp.]